MNATGSSRTLRRAIGIVHAALWFCLLAGSAQAQLARPKADVVALVESDAVRAGGKARVALRVSLPEGLHVQSNRPRDPLLIPTVLTVDTVPGVTVDEIVYPASTDFEQVGQAQPLAVFEREFAIGVVLSIATDARPGPIAVPVRLRYQACDATICYPPQTAQTEWALRVVSAGMSARRDHRDLFDGIRFGSGERPGETPPPEPAKAPGLSSGQATIAAPSSGASRTPAGDGLAQLNDFTVVATTGGYLGTEDFLQFIRNAESGVTERGWFEGRGPLAILLIVLLGGLALNLTPCVLPMVPINLAIIGAGARAGSRARGFLLGSAYGAAMAFVYGILGLIVILTAGTFGTLNASPWFNAAIAALFVVLGLAMFDVIAIDFSRFSSGMGEGASRGTFALAFTMGAVAALLAGACVAPVVIQVVVFSSNLYATGTTLALALPFCLGVGMAIPWPIAGAGLAALPKPGIWMERVKQAFGVVILGTAAYYGYLSYELFANRWVDPAAVTSSVEEKLKEGWYASLAEGLAAAAREQKPVLIDLWATWCKNCLTMDKTTLQNETVRSALNGYVKIKYQAESPDEPPASRVMQRVGAVGLPTYVILRGRNPSTP
jgi:thiol:disulfide interchange protein